MSANPIALAENIAKMEVYKKEAHKAGFLLKYFSVSIQNTIR